MLAAFYNRTACVQALVAAKAALDIKDVSDARLLACPVTIESLSISKSHKHLLKLVSCAVVCVCVCVCVRRVVSFLSLVLGDCAFSLCLQAIKLIL